MADLEPPRASDDAPFAIGPWRVEPSLNRLRRRDDPGAEAVRVEPKMMDVLRLLAQQPRQVVTKDALADAVWPDVFVTESVITRAIAGLRRALGDDARAPRFIETIAKRGYRLVVVPTALSPRATVAAPSGTVTRPRAPSTPPAGALPMGQWVYGPAFHGRQQEIRDILDGPRNGIWVLGTRAIGKTSLLKHLEWLAAHDPERRYLPVFWDLQGCTDIEAFDQDFVDALCDAEAHFDACDLRLDDFTDGPFVRTVGRLRRDLQRRGRTLLLLWDEAEELIGLQRQSPALLRKLRRALQSQVGIRTVMASSARLWQLAEQRDDTSPFLHGFAPPTYLGPLDDDAARALVRRHEPRGADAPLTDHEIDALLRHTGGHPSLLHLALGRLHQLGDLDAALDALDDDATARFHFAVDHELLDAEERSLLRSLANEGADHPALDTPAARAHVHHLAHLGLIDRAGDRPTIAYPLLARWLRRTDQKV